MAGHGEVELGDHGEPATAATSGEGNGDGETS